MPRLALPCYALLLALSLLSVRSAIGQQREASTTEPSAAQYSSKLAKLPTSPDQWLNSGPLPLESLEGKGIVFYYFEEQCPTCEGRWPDILAVAERHRDEPVVFIAVNSGNSPDQIRGYLKRNNIDWPVIVDPDRTFEASSLGMTISLQNIYQARMITVDGKWKGANPNELDEAATTASEGGSWMIDPASMPEELSRAWHAVEIGDFGSAARPVMRAGREGDASTKAAAKQLFDVVQGTMDTDLAAIGQQLKAGQNWPAYQALEQFVAKYDGYPMHPAVAEKREQVSQLPEVQSENKAAKKLAAAIRTGSRNTPAAVKKAVAMLEVLIEDYPDTQAAADAQRLLDEVNRGDAASEG